MEEEKEKENSLEVWIDLIPHNNYYGHCWELSTPYLYIASIHIQDSCLYITTALLIKG